ncbi:unnamed protein product [Urochloa humidicola]
MAAECLQIFKVFFGSMSPQHQATNNGGHTYREQCNQHGKSLVLCFIHTGVIVASRLARSKRYLLGLEQENDAELSQKPFMPLAIQVLE